MHDEIGAARNLWTRLAAGLPVTVAELLAHVLAPDEGGVADDELDLRPGRRARIAVIVGAESGHFRSGTGSPVTGCGDG